MVELPVDIKLRLDFKQFPLKMQKKKFPRISNKQNTSELCVDVELCEPVLLPRSFSESKDYCYYGFGHFKLTLKREYQVGNYQVHKHILKLIVYIPHALIPHSVYDVVNESMTS